MSNSVETIYVTDIIFLYLQGFRKKYLDDECEKVLFFVTADAERIAAHPGWLVLRSCFFARTMAVKTILETQGRVHFYHLRVLAVTDIARGRGRI